LRISRACRVTCARARDPNTSAYTASRSARSLDLGEPILPRHPARADAPLRGTLAQVEPGQALRRHEVTPPVVEHAQILQNRPASWPYPWHANRPPHLPRARTQGEVACRAIHRKVMFLHTCLPQRGRGSRKAEQSGNVPRSAFPFRVQVTRMVTTSCGSATNRTVLPRPRAPGRPIRARRRVPDGHSSHSHRIATPRRLPTGRVVAPQAQRRPLLRGFTADSTSPDPPARCRLPSGELHASRSQNPRSGRNASSQSDGSASPRLQLGLRHRRDGSSTRLRPGTAPAVWIGQPRGPAGWEVAARQLAHRAQQGDQQVSPTRPLVLRKSRAQTARARALRRPPPRTVRRSRADRRLERVVRGSTVNRAAPRFRTPVPEAAAPARQRASVRVTRCQPPDYRCRDAADHGLSAYTMTTSRIPRVADSRPGFEAAREAPPPIA